MLQKTENSTIVTRYYYNAQNKLARIDLPDGGYYEFLYDSQNRKIALCHNGTWRKIIHNGNIPIGELDATNGISRWFVRGLGIAEGTGDVIAELRTEDGGQMTAHFYLANHRGNTVVVLNDSGTVECELQYDAFGLPITEYRLPNTDFSPKFTFSTKEYLSDAELYLYAYRVYDPIAGRWTQRDPIDYQDSINLYQFCGNNPVNSIDELGQDRQLVISVLMPGHMAIQVDTYDKNGKVKDNGSVLLHFTPFGENGSDFQMEDSKNSTYTYITIYNISSNQKEDEAIVSLWYHLIYEEVEGWNPLLNCWVMSIWQLNFGIDKSDKKDNNNNEDLVYDKTKRNTINKITYSPENND